MDDLFGAEGINIENVNNVQKKWYDKVRNNIQKISTSNGCRYYDKYNLKIGIICDEFFFDSISSATDFVYVTPDNWNSICNNIDLFLYVSTWRGLHEEWKGAVSQSRIKKYYQAKRILTKEELERKEFSVGQSLQNTIIDIIEYCNEKKIPTVFYSKEDPPNFWYFVELAKHCKYIFTSSIECIQDYKDICKNERVYPLCFCINPLIHNPIGFREAHKEKDIIFSGSWMTKYEERCKDLSLLFQGVFESSYKLHIFDRNYPANKRYAYPKMYENFILPAVQHKYLQKIHKTADWAININTVKKSETMFANRAFELLANGINLLSNYSVGINSILPCIFIVHNKNEVNFILNSLNDSEIYEKQIFGIRMVMRKDTCFVRLNQLLKHVINSKDIPERKILVLTQKIDAQVLKCFERQTYNNKTLKEVNNISEKEAKEYDIVAFFSNDSEYEEFYLEDMANAFKYTDCDYITKEAWLNGTCFHRGVEHDYVSSVSSKYRTLFWRNKFKLSFLINIEDGCLLKNGYALDRFNYNAGLYQNKENRKKYKISVIIPIYNNGEHLYGKCFLSLRRSSIFDEMELVFVDDGSTDTYTLAIERWLERHYNNIQLFCFCDGGSGSASRPRNKGVEIASSRYITFLDPDNEAISDGYAVLYDKIKDSNYDFILGNMIKSDTEDRVADYFNSIVSLYGSNEVINTEKFLSTLNFMSPSIQAMIIKKDFLLNNKLEEIVGAVGQDTLFAWQIMHTSSSFLTINVPIHVYYAQTSGSVTNLVETKFFTKLFKCQKAKYKWLVESNYIDDFIDLRFNNYMLNIILKKLANTDRDCEIECTKKCFEIYKIFDKYYKKNNKNINTFVDYCRKNEYKKALNSVFKLFPKNNNSLTPPLSSIISKEEKTIKCGISIIKTKSIIRISIINNDNKTKYALSISNALRNFKTIYESKYDFSHIIEYDFKILKPGLYSIQIHEKTMNLKITNEIAIIKNDLYGNTIINKDYLIADEYIDVENVYKNDENVERGTVSIKKENVKNKGGITIKKIDNKMYEFYPNGEYIKYKNFAWYVYTDMSNEPVAKRSSYSGKQIFRYTFTKKGKYRIKMFCIDENNHKESVFSDFFAVIIN